MQRLLLLFSIDCRNLEHATLDELRTGNYDMANTSVDYFLACLTLFFNIYSLLFYSLSRILG